MSTHAGHPRVWQFLLQQLEANMACAFLLVIDSQGSSPGRRGFKMAVSADGEMYGSIGGGIMEHKLVELAKTYLQDGGQKAIFKRQIHQAESPKDRSGMICSGEQVVVIIPLYEVHKPLLRDIISAFLQKQSGVLAADPGGISFEKGDHYGERYLTNIWSERSWTYREALFVTDIVHIIGGGHVGRALSRQMSFLGFYVKIYDNRPGLNTMESNIWADEKIIAGYEKIGPLIPSDENAFVVIMTFGYRDDKNVLKQLIDSDFRYLAMMGSEAKVEQLFSECLEEGIPEAELDKVFAPAGLDVNSKTPEEIAVSVAAEIVKIRNAGE